MSKWPRFRNRKWLKWLWLKWLHVMSFLSCVFVVSRTSRNFAITKSKAIWNRCGVSNITRWLQWNYCPLPTASCKVISKPFLSTKLPLLHTKSHRQSRAFYSLLLTVFTLIFVSCTTDEGPVHEVMRGYFDESQGLFSQNSDSISRFSYKVNEFISRVPAAKNDPFYIKITENLEKVSLKPTITVNDEWDGEIFVTF